MVRSVCLILCARAASAQFDIAINNARVVDPESRLDAVRHLGIRDGKIAAVSQQPLRARLVIDATGLVAAPGFIDLHWHGQDPASDPWEAMDGVTSSLELEIGTADIDGYYKAREGRSMIHHGAAAGHAPVRMKVMNDPGRFVPSGPAASRAASPEEETEIRRRVEAELKKGAVAVGIGVAYTPGAAPFEIVDMFRIAKRFDAPVHTHIRFASSVATGHGRQHGLLEVIAAAAATGASLQVVHVNSSGQGDTAAFLKIIEEARARGIDVTTEAYPYTAGATSIDSAIFDGAESREDSFFPLIQWIATGERLTRETFRKYRKQGGTVILHTNTEERVDLAVTHPLTMIASDGFDVREQGHPRSAGTYAKILGRYVREKQSMSLMDAIRKMSLMPAQRLEMRVPAMRYKGRIRVGADADLAVFDPARVIDRSTYERPMQYSEGMRWVLVNGTPVVADGKPVTSAFPGRAIRAPSSSDR
ncbi:MAG: amidohydrolase family protein [Acidobacteria bacterium]|nr:amidohydrolase family protein [Acidobacteriota bacterium]